MAKLHHHIFILLDAQLVTKVVGWHLRDRTTEHFRLLILLVVNWTRLLLLGHYLLLDLLLRRAELAHKLVILVLAPLVHGHLLLLIWLFKYVVVHVLAFHVNCRGLFRIVHSLHLSYLPGVHMVVILYSFHVILNTCAVDISKSFCLTLQVSFLV